MKEYDESYGMCVKDEYQDKIDRQQPFGMFGQQGFGYPWRPQWQGGYWPYRPFRPYRPFWPFWFFGLPFFREE